MRMRKRPPGRLDDQPSPEALDFLQEHGMWLGLRRAIPVARLLDKFAEQQAKNWLFRNIQGWVEECQPTDLRNRTTAEMQDELHRRQQEITSCPQERTGVPVDNASSIPIALPEGIKPR